MQDTQLITTLLKNGLISRSAISLCLCVGGVAVQKNQKNTKLDLEKFLQQLGEPVKRLYRKANGRMTFEECLEYMDPLSKAKELGALESVMEECIADFLKRKRLPNNKK